MDEFPRDLVLLMDELSAIDFCKLAFYKLNKIKINNVLELEELEKVMCKAMDLSTKMKLGLLSPALKDRFFKVLAEKGLDKPPSLLANIALEHSKLPTSTNRGSPALYIEDNQPKLFQNTSKPADVDPNSYKPKSNSPPHGDKPIKREQDPYKSGMLELDAIKQGQAKARQQYREESPSPPRAYRARSQSRPRESRRSRSPPSYKGRSSSRPRRSRSRSRSPPPARSYSRFDDRSPPSSRSFSRRSRSPGRKSPPSVRSYGRRSRSPPSQRSRRSRSPPSMRSFSRKSRSPPSVREGIKEEEGDEDGGARKGGLSFSLAPRKKMPMMEKPPFKFT